MSTSSPAPPAPAPLQDSLSDSELMRLSEKVKAFTWVIKPSFAVEKKIVERFCTGFAINVDKCFMKNSIGDNDVVLMTCAHAFRGHTLHGVVVRRLEDEIFLKAEVVNMKNNWDIAILVVKDAHPAIRAEFVDDGSIFSGQTLLHVGHSGGLVWSAFVGRAAYPCVNTLAPLIDDDETCESYVCTSFETTPRYRIMGHLLNKGYFQKDGSMEFSFAKDTHPCVPIIQSVVKTEKGISGGPVCNTRGQIVGMMVMTMYGCSISIHVTLLKEFVKFHLGATKDSNENERGKKSLVGGHNS